MSRTIAQRSRLLSRVACLVLLAGAAGAADPFLAEFADPWQLAVLRDARTYHVSTTDPDGANIDWSHFVRIGMYDAFVIADVAGPGVITHLWLTAESDEMSRGRIRFTFDDAETPTIDMALLDYFQRNSFPFQPPLHGDSAGGYYSYVPLAFQSRCLIEVYLIQGRRFYYNVDYRALPPGTEVQTFSLPLGSADTSAMQRALDAWLHPGRDPKSERAGTAYRSFRSGLPAGARWRVFSATGAGELARLELTVTPRSPDLWLRLGWDGAKEPAVEAPVDLFFCAGAQATRASGLLLGLRPAGYYCYLPMPYDDGAWLELVNTGNQGIGDIVVAAAFAPPRDGTAELGRLHAWHNRDPYADTSEDHLWLERRARGHFIGVCLTAEGGEAGLNYLEGDERIAVDGEWPPAIWGTGTEDYFNGGWYFGTSFSKPLHGCPVFLPNDNGRTVMYRIHHLDAVPFQRRIRATVEHGTTNEVRAPYESVAFWYEAPGSLITDPWEHAPATLAVTGEIASSTNLLTNPGAEQFLYGWRTGGRPNNLPMIDPLTHFADPDNHSGKHRFGISIGYATADCYQYQEIGVEPGKTYEAGFWAAHQDGTDEVFEMTWIDGEWPGAETSLLATRPEAEPQWTHFGGARFTPSAATATIVLRFRHPIASGIASIHLDDTYVVEVHDGERAGR